MRSPPTSSSKLSAPAGQCCATSPPISRFEAPAAHGCRMVIAAIDALAQLITGQPHLFADQDVGTRRNQTGEEIGAAAIERLRWHP
jgi:hypothetical protein